jgi:hypothetical protein
MCFLYWLVVDLPLRKYDFVSWDDDIPSIWKNNIDVSNHQPNPLAKPGLLTGRNVKNE